MSFRKLLLNTINIRLLPAVILTAGLLFTIKITNLIFFPEKYTTTSPLSYAQEKTHQENTNTADKDSKNAQENATLDNEETHKKSDTIEKNTAKSEEPQEQKVAVSESYKYSSEKDILSKLRQRREELEKMEQSLNVKKSLIALSEKRLDEKIQELKELEKQEEQKKQRNELSKEQKLKHVIKMYEGMKPAEAALILNQLKMPILKKIALNIKSKSMAKILAKMDVNIAQRLTTELAEMSTDAKEGLSKITNKGELPRIGG